MDAALLKAVEAPRRALEQIVGQAWTCGKSRSVGAKPTSRRWDMFFGAVAKAAQGRRARRCGVRGTKILETVKLKGTSNGMLASQSVGRCSRRPRPRAARRSLGDLKTRGG